MGRLFSKYYIKVGLEKNLVSQKRFAESPALISFEFGCHLIRPSEGVANKECQYCRVPSPQKNEKTIADIKIVNRIALHDIL